MVLTERGQEFLSHAYAILKQAENARVSMLGGDKPPAGIVRFGVPGSLVELLTVPDRGLSGAIAPGSPARGGRGCPAISQGWLRDGTLDAALVFGDWGTTDVGARLQPIVEEDLYVGTYEPGLLASHLTDTNEIRLQDLQHLRLVMPGPEHGLRLLVETVARRHKIPLNVVMEIDATPQIFKIIRRGHGSTICSRAASKLDSNENSTGSDARLHTFRVVDPGIKRRCTLPRPLTVSPRVPQLQLHTWRWKRCYRWRRRMSGRRGACNDACYSITASGRGMGAWEFATFP